MLPTSIIRRSLAVGALALLAACGAPDSASAPTAGPAATQIAPSSTPIPTLEPSATPIPVPTLTPSPLPFPTPTENVEPSPGTAEDTVPENVLLQLDYLPGFTRPELFSPAGRVPPFTLLDDGRVIYVDPGNPPSFGSERVVVGQLTPEQAQALRQQVLDLGFERLESHTDMCKDQNGQQACVADASTSVLRVRLPSGELRQINNYADFANEPETLAAILTLLREYRMPDAQPYVPEQAALFLQRAESAPEQVTVQEWPLDPALLTPPQTDARQWATVLEGQELNTLLGTVDRNTGDFFFEHDGTLYNAYLAPWLPGEDYTQEVQQFVIRG